MTWLLFLAWLVCRSVSYYTTLHNWQAGFSLAASLGTKIPPAMQAMANWIVWELTSRLNDLWLIQLSKNWPTDWMIYGLLNCPGTGHRTEWFQPNWIVQGLANWLNDLWLIELSGDWQTHWKIYGWFIHWLTNSTVQGLANWLNDFRLIELSRDWPTDWMIYG